MVLVMIYWWQSNSREDIERADIGPMNINTKSDFNSRVPEYNGTASHATSYTVSEQH